MVYGEWSLTKSCVPLSNAGAMFENQTHFEDLIRTIFLFKMFSDPRVLCFLFF